MNCETTEKSCSKCKQIKDISLFHKQRSRKLGTHSWCKACFNANAKANRLKQSTPEQRVRNNLWSRYRLRPSDVRTMLKDQNGLCAICKTTPTRQVIDHCHTTGHVRGILCHGCNIKLPAIEDASFRAAALNYLGRIQQIETLTAKGE